MRILQESPRPLPHHYHLDLAFEDWHQHPLAAKEAPLRHESRSENQPLRHSQSLDKTPRNPQTSLTPQSGKRWKTGRRRENHFPLLAASSNSLYPNQMRSLPSHTFFYTCNHANSQPRPRPQARRQRALHPTIHSPQRDPIRMRSRGCGRWSI